MVITLYLLSRYHWADFNETFYEASETLALYVLFKSCPLIDIDLFYGRSNFATYTFILENVTMMDSTEIVASCNLESG